MLYIWFSTSGKKSAQIVTVVPGVHADFDAKGKLIGIEVLEASTVLDKKVQFEAGLPTNFVQKRETEFKTSGNVEASLEVMF